MKITVLDGYAACPGDISWDGMKALGEFTLYDRTSPAEVVERAKDSEVILTNKVVINKEVIDQLPNLKYVGVLATGFNIVDTKYAREKGIIVTNIPAYSTDSVAQMVFAHIFNITNDIAHYAAENRNGRWTNSPDFCYMDNTLHEVASMSIGIYGLGSIGKKVAEVAHAFGMKVYAVSSKEQSQLPEYVTKLSLDEMFATADIITLHCPLTDATKEMINAESLKKVKKGAILVNTGRGPLVNEQDVADALASGQLGAFCADVLTVEPARADNPLLTAPNCYLTPHIAWATFEARVRLMDIAVNNVAAYKNGSPINVVN